MDQDQGALSENARAEIERVGAALLVVGLVTTGPSAALPAVAAALRAGLDAQDSGQPAVAIHIDRGTSDEPFAILSQALGDARIIRVRASHGVVGVTDDEAERREDVRTVLAAGLALGARTIVMLDSDVLSMTAGWLRALADPVEKEEYALVLPVYQRGRYEGTLTHTLVIPLLRALFGRRLLHPLAESFGCSAVAADFLLKQDVWGAEVTRQELELWIPVAAIERGLPIGQAVLGPRAVSPRARPAPLGPTVGHVAGALFQLAERFESAWLELSGSEAVPTFGSLPEPLLTGHDVDTERLLLGFRQGVRDLLPIWERILAPENLGDVLALGDSATDHFRFPDHLWARVVYDFLLAFRARVVYRHHVAQSLAPLYLGRAASLILGTRAGPASAVTLAGERLGQVFEEQKPYLVDRWR